MATPAQLVPDDHCLSDGATDSLKKANIHAPVLPANMENPSQATLMISLQSIWVVSVHSQGL